MNELNFQLSSFVGFQCLLLLVSIAMMILGYEIALEILKIKNERTTDEIEIFFIQQNIND